MKKVILFMFLATGIVLFHASCQNSGANKLSIAEATQLLEKSQNLQLIDVRSAEEFASGHLKGAVNIGISDADFESRMLALSKNQPVYIYCLSGGRSSSAASFLRKNGFSKVTELPGIIQWRNANYPLETASNAAPAAQGMTLNDFQTLIQSSEFVLIDYNASWCQPCKIMAPYLAKSAEARKTRLRLAPIDADANPDLLKANHIEALPTLVLFQLGKEIWTHTGLVEENELEKILSSHIQ